MADISKITLPSGSQYNIKDTVARQEIETIKNTVTGAMHYLGVTTIELSDGASTNPITIDSESVTAKSGDVVINGDMEFIFSDTDNKWHEYGNTGSLKALAFKDEASGEYTPAGTVSKPTFTGTESNVTVTVAASNSGNYTPAGTVSAPTFTGDKFEASASYTPEGTIKQPTFTGTKADIQSTGKFTPAGEVTFTNEDKTTTVSKATSGTATYTPEGTVTPTVTLNSTTVNSITDVGTLPTCTMPVLETTVANENLTLSWTDGAFTQGTLPTKGDDVTVATDVKSATATFTGTGARLVTGNISVPSSAKFTGTEGNITATASYTPAGTNTGAEFTGTEGNITIDGTPTGTISQPTFTGTKVEISGKTTATGDVSQPTFTGTQDTITVS